MSASAEQIDDLLEWRPGPPQAASTGVIGALGWGIRRAWASKFLIVYLWLFYFLIVERAATLFLQTLRATSSWADGARLVLESAATGSIPGSILSGPVAETGSVFSGPATATGFRAVAMASLEWTMWSPESYFILFYGVLAGGVIAYLHAPRPAPLLAQLGANCGVYLGRFLRLLIVAAFLWGGLSAIAGRLSLRGAAGILLWLQIIALQLGVTFLAMTLDYARVRTVARDSRSMVMETWRSVRFVFGNLPRTFALHLLLIALVLLSGGAFFGIAAALRAVLPPSVAGAVAEQLFVAGLLWVRLAMWGAELSLYQGITAASLADRSAD